MDRKTGNSKTIHSLPRRRPLYPEPTYSVNCFIAAIEKMVLPRAAALHFFRLSTSKQRHAQSSAHEYAEALLSDFIRRLRHSAHIGRPFPPFECCTVDSRHMPWLAVLTAMHTYAHLLGVMCARRWISFKKHLKIALCANEATQKRYFQQPWSNAR